MQVQWAGDKAGFRFVARLSIGQSRRPLIRRHDGGPTFHSCFFRGVIPCYLPDFGHCCARLKQAASFFADFFACRLPHVPRIFVVVGGRNDVEFLRRLATMLHAADSSLPDLAAMEQRRELLFVPCGGGDSRSWTYRLAWLGAAEFHLLDRDIEPATSARRVAVDIDFCSSCLETCSGCRRCVCDGCQEKGLCGRCHKKQQEEHEHDATENDLQREPVTTSA